MKLGLATVAAFAALVAAVPAHASVPVPWCGASSALDLPDATPGYAVHVAYVRPPGGADRLGELAPRLTGDAASIDAWWRGDDATRSLRFDAFAAPGCASAFGALDITNVELPQPVSGIDSAFSELRSMVTDLGFREADKAYLVYYDGPTGQVGDERVCGQGAAPSFARSGIAIVYLDSCGGDTGDALRPIVAVHELVHVFGAVSSAAPHHCELGHVCDFPQDLMTAFLSGSELESLVLDSGRDDYYGHAGGWSDVQDSLFLERLDSPDKAPPAAPQGLRIGDDPSGLVRISWRASADDVGPVSYRVYENGTFFRELTSTSVLLLPASEGIGRYSVRAADPVGHLSPVSSGHFLAGVGMVDEQGKLIRDTVRPPSVRRVTIKRARKSVTLSWPVVRDAGGLRGYRVRIGSRTVLVRKAAITIARSRLRPPVSITAVDRAGNVGPALGIALSRLR
ncbi:MAG: hypothetical protein ACRDNB_07000 [Gaiellaceae bacterium]